MPHWLLKSGLQNLTGLLPSALGERVNETFQRSRGALACGRGYFENRLEHCHRHLIAFANGESLPQTALELGTGWHPILPIGLFLCGVEKGITIDIRPFLTTARALHVVGLFQETAGDGSLARLLPRLQPQLLPSLEAAQRLGADAPITRVMACFNVEVAVQDARATSLPGQSVDLIASSGTLQHIPTEILRGLFREFHRLMTPRGVTSHWIKLRDIYSTFDARLSPYNFYRFSDRAWKILESPFENQNRLRPREYRELLLESGFEVVKEDIVYGSEEDLARVPIHSRFASYPKEELLALDEWLTASPIPHPSPA